MKSKGNLRAEFILSWTAPLKWLPPLVLPQEFRDSTTQMGAVTNELISTPPHASFLLGKQSHDVYSLPIVSEWHRRFIAFSLLLDE